MRMQQPTTIAEALKLRFPEPIVLVVTRRMDGRANVMAVGWTGMASGDPPMIMLGIDAEAWTYTLVRETRAFVVAFPSETMGHAVLHAGSVHGHKRDKLAEAGLQTEPARYVLAPLLSDAVANFECELVTIVQPGDCPLIFGRIVAAHVHQNRDLKRLYTIGPGHCLGGVRAVPETIVRPPHVPPDPFLPETPQSTG
jgi:flavin reductase (DIM6/NTAB) family NADH-FMN oxidoreductase RutF